VSTHSSRLHGKFKFAKRRRRKSDRWNNKQKCRTDGENAKGRVGYTRNARQQMAASVTRGWRNCLDDPTTVIPIGHGGDRFQRCINEKLKKTRRNATSDDSYVTTQTTRFDYGRWRTGGSESDERERTDAQTSRSDAEMRGTEGSGAHDDSDVGSGTRSARDGCRNFGTIADDWGWQWILVLYHRLAYKIYDCGTQHQWLHVWSTIVVYSRNQGRSAVCWSAVRSLDYRDNMDDCRTRPKSYFNKILRRWRTAPMSAVNV